MIFQQTTWTDFCLFSIILIKSRIRLLILLTVCCKSFQLHFQDKIAVSYPNVAMLLSADVEMLTVYRRYKIDPHRRSLVERIHLYRVVITFAYFVRNAHDSFLLIYDANNWHIFFGRWLLILWINLSCQIRSNVCEISRKTAESVFFSSKADSIFLFIRCIRSIVKCLLRNSNYVGKSRLTLIVYTEFFN